jgi:glycosyltransferase involved in cell wall biosynthesis
VSEGFGLPPIEALACGCVVFSSLNHALADLLDPGVIGHQLGAGSLEGDLVRISAAVADPWAWRPEPAALETLLDGCREVSLLQRWRAALEGVNRHWDQLQAGAAPLLSPPRWQLQLLQRLRPIGSLAGRLGLTPLKPSP